MYSNGGNVERRLSLMCNLSGAIVELGMEKGMEQLIANFKKKITISTM